VWLLDAKTPSKISFSQYQVDVAQTPATLFEADITGVTNFTELTAQLVWCQGTQKAASL
jgi:hypothetical protein